MINKLSDNDLKMVVGGFEDIVPLLGEDPGGPSYPQVPGPSEWNLPDDTEAEGGESPYM